MLSVFQGFQKGVNLGGWLSQADHASHEHYETFITQRDIGDIAAMGFDHVRLPIDYFVIEDEEGAPRENGYQYIDRCVSWCGERGLHVLLVLHKTFGYTFDPLEDADRERFFFDEGLQGRFFRLWDRISARYAACDYVAFELLNEIISPAVAEAWNQIADRAVQVIRKNAPEAPIVIGGVNYNSVGSVELLHPPADRNIVYNFHCYEPLAFTHQRAYWVRNMPGDLTVRYPDQIGAYRSIARAISPELAGLIDRGDFSDDEWAGTAFFEALFSGAIRKAEEHDVPLYCGEYGVIDRAPVEDALRWHQDINAVFAKHRIGHALWNYKEKDFGLINAPYAPVIQGLV